MDQNCTTDQYGNTGCIGTAVTTHGGGGVLPYTGFDSLGVLLLAISLVLAGIALRLNQRG